MKFKGIIITGTSGAGKSTIAKEIVQKEPLFSQVKAITTRAPREDDNSNYIYVDENNFAIFHDKNFLMTETSYRGKKYGVSIFAVDEVEKTHHYPLFIISPESINNFKHREDYLSFFIDAEDMQLDERLEYRDKKPITNEVYQQRKRDRLQSDISNYIVMNNDIKDTVELICQLWNYAGIGGMLPEKIIKLMISCGMLVKNADVKNVQV